MFVANGIMLCRGNKWISYKNLSCLGTCVVYICAKGGVEKYKIVKVNHWSRGLSIVINHSNAL